MVSLDSFWIFLPLWLCITFSKVVMIGRTVAAYPQPAFPPSFPSKPVPKTLP